MTPPVKTHLYETYPQFFEDGDDENVFECGDGWLWLIDTFLETLTKIQGLPEVIRILKIRDVDGRMRISSIAQGSFDRDGSARLQGIVALAETQSERICQRCGEPTLEGVGCDGCWT